MSNSLEEVEADALKLSAEERAGLIERLNESLAPARLSPEWRDEIERRLADRDAGRVRAAPADEVLARLGERLRRAQVRTAD